MAYNPVFRLIVQAINTRRAYNDSTATKDPVLAFALSKERSETHHRSRFRFCPSIAHPGDAQHRSDRPINKVTTLAGSGPATSVVTPNESEGTTEPRTSEKLIKLPGVYGME
jgi:hypothetical protein